MAGRTEYFTYILFLCTATIVCHNSHCSVQRVHCLDSDNVLWRVVAIILSITVHRLYDAENRQFLLCRVFVQLRTCELTAAACVWQFVFTWPRKLTVCITVIRPHRSTMYVEEAYCYRPSSTVCPSVCLSHSEPCKNG